MFRDLGYQVRGFRGFKASGNIKHAFVSVFGAEGLQGAWGVWGFYGFRV